MAGRLSGLTTRGRCLFAAGTATAVCALVLDERDLLRVGAFVALLPLLALLVAARTRRTVTARRVLDPPRVPAGADVTVTVHLHGGPLLGALRLADAVPDGAGPSPAAPPRFTVHRLSARSGGQLAYPLRPAQRGVHRIGPLTAGVGDPLGLAEYERELAGPSTLLALPRVVPLSGQPPSLGAGEGNPGAALAHTGQGQSGVLVRAYRQGDELRRVHWRSSARHDELMVRLEERPRHSGTTVLLDRRDDAHRGRGPASSLEFAVSLVASVGVHLIARGEPVSVVTEDGAVLSPGPEADPLLDALAALRPVASSDLAGPELAPGGDLVAVLGSVGPGRLDALLARRAGGGCAVLLDVPTWDPAGPTAAKGPAPADPVAKALRRAGWRVAVARAGTTPDRVWSELASGGLP